MDSPYSTRSILGLEGSPLGQCCSPVLERDLFPYVKRIYKMNSGCFKIENLVITIKETFSIPIRETFSIHGWLVSHVHKFLSLILREP
jgi:hypothetical protein